MISVASSRAVPAADAQDIGTIISNVSDTSIAGMIRGLQNFGTRIWSNANRDSVARWVRAKFIAAGLTMVTIDSFYYNGTWQKNVIATIPGTATPAREIVFGAHMDSYSSNVNLAPGADDNASGVAAVVEIARIIRKVSYVPGSTLRFIAFGAEEAGLRGSADYAMKANLAGQPIIAMFNFDMIGYRNPRKAAREFFLNWYSNARPLAVLDSLMARTYTTLTPILSTSVASRSDSYSFYNYGFQAVFSFDGGTSTAYHTPNDIIDSLDMSFAREITQASFAAALTIDATPTSIAPSPEELPRQFALEQNYPNPFNPATEIPYQLSAGSRVTVKVYDLLGREVATLAEGWREAGRYSVRWDARGAASGVYLCRLQWEGGSQTRRMVLTR
jgi:leucyl aminopeptidase